METHEYQLTIEKKHLDSFGHVNNAVYLELYEQARWDLITQRGYGLDRVKESGLGPVILEINIKFKKELCLNDNVTIETQSKETTHSLTFEVQQKMIKESGEVASSIVLTAGLFDTGRRKLVKPTDEWLRAIKLKS